MGSPVARNRSSWSSSPVTGSRGRRRGRYVQIAAGLVAIVAAVVLGIGTVGAVTGPGTGQGEGEGTTGTPPPGDIPLQVAPQAGAPTTAPAAPGPSAGVLPVPVEVQGAEETRQPTGELARTGPSESTYYLSLALLSVGLLLVATSGLLAERPARIKGGYTLRTFNRGGDPVVIRTTTRC